MAFSHHSFSFRWIMSLNGIVKLTAVGDNRPMGSLYRRHHLGLINLTTHSGVFQVKEGYVHGTGDGDHPVVVAGKCDRLALVAQVFA